MQGVSESMAGRAAVLQLYPLSARETPKVTLLRGGYPEVRGAPGGRPTVVRVVPADLPRTGCPGGDRGQGPRDVPPLSGVAREPPRAGAQQDRSGRAAWGQRADHHPVARRAGDDGADPDRPAVLRESRQAPDQVAKGVSRRFRARLSSAGHRFGGRAGQVAVRRQLVRGLRSPRRSSRRRSTPEAAGDSTTSATSRVSKWTSSSRAAAVRSRWWSARPGAP